MQELGSDHLMDGLSKLSNVNLEVMVVVGCSRLSIGEAMKLEKGTLLALNRRTTDPVALLIGDRLIAFGELEEGAEKEGALLSVRIVSLGETEC